MSEIPTFKRLLSQEDLVSVTFKSTNKSTKILIE
jgi:hypothetical protein